MATRSNLSQTRSDLSQTRANLSQARTSAGNRLLVDTNFAGVSGAVLYLDPSRGADYDGSNVMSNWFDMISQKPFTTTTTASKPTFSANGFGTGIPGISFNGTANQLAMNTPSPLTTNNDWTLYAVLKATSITGNRCAFNLGSGGNGYALTINLNGNGKREVRHNGVANITDGNATTNAEIWCASRSTAATPTTLLSVNNVSQTLSSPTSSLVTTTKNAQVGNLLGGSFFSGLIGHILLYPTEHNSATKTIINNALNAIYNIY